MMKRRDILFVAGLAGLAASASAAAAYLTFPMRDASRVSVLRVMDKGMIRELVVACDSAREATIVHAPLDRLWCDAAGACAADLEFAVKRACAAA